MKIIRTEEIDIPKTDFKRLMKYISELDQKQIKLFICEFADVEGTHSDPLKFFRLIATEKEFEFLWQSADAKYLYHMWEKVQEELQRGYFIGLDEYSPYPETIISKLTIPAEELLQKKEYLLSVFESSDYKKALQVFKAKSEEQWDDSQ